MVSSQELELRNIAHAFSQLEYEAYEKRRRLILMLTNAEFTRYKRALERSSSDIRLVEKYTALMESRYVDPEKRKKFIEAHKALDEVLAQEHPTSDVINKAYSLFPEQNLDLSD